MPVQIHGAGKVPILTAIRDNFVRHCYRFENAFIIKTVHVAMHQRYYSKLIQQHNTNEESIQFSEPSSHSLKVERYQNQLSQDLEANRIL